VSFAKKTLDKVFAARAVVHHARSQVPVPTRHVDPHADFWRDSILPLGAPMFVRSVAPEAAEKDDGIEGHEARTIVR
jgi:hypothetical protein